MDPRSLPRARRRLRGGYVMLVALLLIAILAVIGATSLSIAGVDQRIAAHNRKHMLVMNTASAGNEHGRWQLQHEDPPDEGYDTGTDTWGYFVQPTEAEASFGGLAYPQNLGVYWVEATFQRCGNPPPGYSTEIGKTSFRSAYWMVHSTARMQDVAFNDVNETRAETGALLRKVMRGTCKIR
jgi:type II secretory pathway pseudopilin PulG